MEPSLSLILLSAEHLPLDGFLGFGPYTWLL
jgi:hypothetical protein